MEKRPLGAVCFHPLPFSEWDPQLAYGLWPLHGPSPTEPRIWGSVSEQKGLMYPSSGELPGAPGHPGCGLTGPTHTGIQTQSGPDW